MITYCTNIHPGESWDEVLLNLRTHLLEVKRAVSPDEPFPIGLRLSNSASLSLDENASGRFLDWCRQAGCYVATINGFPYGSFHSSIVKEKVYLPDWRSAERVEYSRRLARLLDVWLPEKITGSISTVPIGFKNHVTSEDVYHVRQNIIHVLEHIDSLKQRSGKEIILAFEPEPGCALETTEDVLRFFEKMKFPEELKDSIGICFDCCHHAVEFESPFKSLSLLSEAGIPLGKIQVSSALRFEHPRKEILDKFSEPCYLHQAVIQKPDGTLVRYNDLSDALPDYREHAEGEWRIHFHVPVFIDKTDSYGTTRGFTEEVLSLLDKNILLEVETYTWQVLPPELRMETVTQSIIREIQWVQEQINEKD